VAPHVKASTLPIPAKAMLDCGAILGKRGAGKSSLARFLLEHEVDIGHRCCFIDPMGDAAGLRLNPDRSPSRFQHVIIFGGASGDIAISEDDGAKVARIVGTHDISCIVDLSLMIQAEQLRFMTAFADVLYDAIKVPVTLFVDEAHLFAPQERGEGTPKLLNRMTRLNAQGRKRGIFLWLMTQRPARINKSVLGGTETFVAMKVVMPQDVKAVAEWFASNGPEAANDVRGQLGTLKVGEAIVFASGSEFFGRVQFPLHSTLDTGRTPLHGETMGGIELPKADVSALAEAFGSIAGADPRDDEIASLKKENAALRDAVRERSGRLDKAAADADAAAEREAALIDLTLDIQHRIGALIGSPRIHPLPAGALIGDFVFVPDSSGDVRPYLRDADNAPHIAGARRRMANAKIPTTPPPADNRGGR